MEWVERERTGDFESVGFGSDAEWCNVWWNLCKFKSSTHCNVIGSVGAHLKGVQEPLLCDCMEAFGASAMVPQPDVMAT